MKKTLCIMILVLGGVSLFFSCDTKVSSDHHVKIDIQNQSSVQISILGSVTYNGTVYSDNSPTVIDSHKNYPYYYSPKWTVTGNGLDEAIKDVDVLLTLTINESNIIRTVNSWDDYRLIVKDSGQGATPIGSLSYDWVVVESN